MQRYRCRLCDTDHTTEIMARRCCAEVHKVFVCDGCGQDYSTRGEAMLCECRAPIITAAHPKMTCIRELPGQDNLFGGPKP